MLNVLSTGLVLYVVLVLYDLEERDERSSNERDRV